MRLRHNLLDVFLGNLSVQRSARVFENANGGRANVDDLAVNRKHGKSGSQSASQAFRNEMASGIHWGTPSPWFHTILQRASLTVAKIFFCSQHHNKLQQSRNSQVPRISAQTTPPLNKRRDRLRSNGAPKSLSLQVHVFERMKFRKTVGTKKTVTSSQPPQDERRTERQKQALIVPSSPTLLRPSGFKHPVVESASSKQVRSLRVALTIKPKCVAKLQDGSKVLVKLDAAQKRCQHR